MSNKCNSLSPISLYIHIPFCKKKCNFCDFNAYEGIDDMIDEYESALIKELEFWIPSLENKKIVSIFIGGGTPSRIEAKKLSNIINIIKNNTYLSSDAEITAEVNPDDIPDWELSTLIDSGVNRLSVGIQSFIDSELILLDRNYTEQFAKKQIKKLKDVGFTNINLDLMYGLVNHTMDNWIYSLKQALELEPTHLSCYALGVEEGTLLKYRIEQGELPAPDDDLAANQYEHTSKTLLSYDYNHYEISNWAKTGYESLHNSSYWNMNEYLGIGAGAHSFMSNNRFSNIKNPREYISAIKTMSLNVNQQQEIKMEQVTEGEKIDESNILNEAMLFGLRMIRGVNISQFQKKYNIDPRLQFNEQIERSKNKGLMIENNTHLKLSEKGLLLSNEVFEDFI
ncbi:MAG: radical SAM family heme chaperone HemW [Dehalococcoidia bacterium]|nr:radical SAM family heme chaperone HemW [Dehalococcoidia bacterium]